MGPHADLRISEVEMLKINSEEPEEFSIDYLVVAAVNEAAAVRGCSEKKKMTTEEEDEASDQRSGRGEDKVGEANLPNAGEEDEVGEANLREERMRCRCRQSKECDDGAKTTKKRGRSRNEKQLKIKKLRRTKVVFLLGEDDVYDI